MRGIGYLVATFTFLLSMSCASSSNPAPPASVTVGQFTGTWFNDDTTSVLEQVVVSNAGNSITSVFFDKCVQNPSPIDCETFVANGGFNGSFVPALYVNTGVTPTQYIEVTISIEGSKLKVILITVGSPEPPVAFLYHKQP